MAGSAVPPSLSRGERIRTYLEHVLDAKSVAVASWLLRRTQGRVSQLWGRRALVLTTRGRKTGRIRSVPVQYFPDGSDVIIAAANSGLAKPPAWYLNLMASRKAVIDIEGRRVSVHATQLSPAEAGAFWPRILEQAPDYERYVVRSGRPLPLIRLTPREPADARGPYEKS